MNEQFPDRWQEWEKTIRDPAEQTKEGLRKLHVGQAHAEYQTAQLPDGRFAVRFTCRMESSAAMSVPWRAFPTREEAVDYFRQETLAFFIRENKLRKEREQARRTMIDFLQGEGLFGFEEPAPET